MAREESGHGLDLDGEEHARSKTAQAHPWRVGMRDIHTEPLPVGMEALRSAAHMSGKHEEMGIQQEHSRGDHKVAVGLGRRSPANHRGSPHFQRALMEVVGDTFDEAACGCGRVRAVCGGGMACAALPPVEALRAPVHADDLKFEVVTPNRKARYPQDILRSSSCYCRLVAQNDLKILDCRLLIPEILEILEPRLLLRRSISQNDRSCSRS